MQAKEHIWKNDNEFSFGAIKFGGNIQLVIGYTGSGAKERHF